MKEITQELIFDIFNISRDGSNIVDDDDDLNAQSGEAQISFEVKASELNNEISSVPVGHVIEATATVVSASDLQRETVAETPKPVEKIEDTKEQKQMPPNKENVETALKGVTDKKLFGDLFDEDEKTEKAVETKTDLLTEPQGEVLMDEVESDNDVSATQDAQVVSEGPDTNAQPQSVTLTETPAIEGKSGGHRWKLNSPSPKYGKLYEEKRHLLSKELLKDGEIPYTSYYEELKNANVDTNVPTYDTEEVGRRMTEVQLWRDRIKAVQLHVNSQYWVWKNIMELLPGVLARIEYERGKMEGLIYEHLNDFFSYFGHLEGLHKSCDYVTKHLDGAYNSLSRQVAIAQPLQEVERFTPNSPKPMTPQLQRFDGLMQANKGVATAPSRSKEAAKPAEPQSGWGVID